jgi:LysM repeat protein
MVDIGSPRDWLPRLLAPIAFFVAATVLILLVQNALSSDDGPTQPTATESSPPPTTTENQTGTGETGTTERPRRRYYRVKEGDLLETIAAEFNTSVEQLLELNPGIDPQALTVGQRIQVR